MCHLLNKEWLTYISDKSISTTRWRQTTILQLWPSKLRRFRNWCAIKSLDVVDNGRWTLHANYVKRQNVVSLTVTVTDIPTATTTIKITKCTSDPSLTATSSSLKTTIPTTFGITTATDSKNSEISRGVSATVVCLTVLGSLVLVTSVVVFFLCLFSVFGLPLVRRHSVHDSSNMTQKT